MPLRGQIVEFDRPLQVKPNSDMLVSFDADPVVPTNVKQDWTWTIGLFVCLFFVLLARPGVEKKWSELHHSLKRREAELAAERDGARETPDPEESMSASYPEEPGSGPAGVEDEGPEIPG